jgi:hypothetical protein
MKAFSEFYAEKRSADGLRYSCKMCDHKRRLKREQGITPEQMERRKKLRSKHRKTEAEYSQKYRQAHRAADLVRHAKKRAERRNLPFDLDQHLTDLDNRLDVGVCEITGVPLIVSVGNGRGPMNPSLDRIVPSLGYVISNVRIVAYALNTAMGNWGLDPLLILAKALVEKEN